MGGGRQHIQGLLKSEEVSSIQASKLDIPGFQYQEDALNCLPYPFPRNRTDLLSQLAFINRVELCNVDHARPRQTPLAFLKADTTRYPRATDIRSNGADDSGLNATLIVGVILDNNVGATVARTRTTGRAKIDPKYITLVDYHCSSSSNSA